MRFGAGRVPRFASELYSAQVWLSAKQRQELGRRAKVEMRTAGNYATAVVLGALAEG